MGAICTLKILLYIVAIRTSLPWKSRTRQTLRLGGTYIYPIVQSMLTNGQVSHITGQLGDHVIPAEWTAYGVKFDAKKLLRPATALVKVGWLLNRGSRQDGNVTAVNLVEFGEIR